MEARRQILGNVWIIASRIYDYHVDNTNRYDNNILAARTRSHHSRSFIAGTREPESVGTTYFQHVLRSKHVIENDPRSPAIANAKISRFLIEG